jgi:hypothetical protein
MSHSAEVQTDHLAQDVAKWENEGGALKSSEGDKTRSWSVPLIVVHGATVSISQL